MNKICINSDVHKLIIVYEDDSVVVVNKPKNMLTHHTKYDTDNTVVDYLIHKVNVDEFEDKSRPGIVQRLDRNTTGLMVVAKNIEAYNSLINQISNNTLTKKYLTIVHGKFKKDSLIIKCPIIRSKKNTTKMVVSDDPKAKDATTIIKVLKESNELSLIECTLVTGRTHQIRVHMNFIHHNVLNDPLYGHEDGYKDYDQFLHSYHLSFYHPITKELLEFKSVPDNTFNSVIKYE
uniref:Pseudouridine synthase n=1 Tax=uncultured Mycoplasmataceae bacterium TaxID=300027 RepID=A0A6G9HHI2_9MOLU|nr:hypothetical protein PlMoll_0410 [uncultured Mycoplasmataceae bacterium]